LGKGVKTPADVFGDSDHVLKDVAITPTFGEAIPLGQVGDTNPHKNSQGLQPFPNDAVDIRNQVKEYAMPIKPVDIEELTSKAKNVHEAIVAMSKRARQINEETKIEFNQRIEMFAPKTESENEENEVNPDQLKVSLEFEKRPKPTDIALDELLRSRLQWRYKEPEEVAKVAEKEEESEGEEE